jgi:Protein of unknown function (DUF4232)
MTYRRLVVCAALLAGCGGHHHAAAAARGPALVPFDAAPPAALSDRPAAAAPACRAADLRVAGRGLVLVPGATSGGTGTLLLRNRGPRACRLTGRPAVRFVGGTAPPPQRERALAPEPLAFPQLAPAAGALRALAPGHGAVLRVDWANWCPRASRAALAKGVAPPWALRIALPGGGRLDARYSAVVPCEHAGRPSVIGVRPFAPEPLRAAAGFTAVPLTATAHPLDGGSGVLRARRGAQLRFAVELRNRSHGAGVRFDGRCPLLAEKFAPVGPTEAHRLNCAAAKPIAPGGARWFEMRVRVPRNAPLGPNGLFWRLDPTGDFGPQVVARVVVRP